MFTNERGKYIWQWVVLPLALGLLLMAMFGVFDEKCEYKQVQEQGLFSSSPSITKQYKNCGHGWYPFIPE